MSSLILLRRVRVENANAIAGLTYGFPAITHFLGFSHALSRRLTKRTGCALMAVPCQPRAPDPRAHLRPRLSVSLTRNPLTGTRKRPPLMKRGACT
jgi:CRISPR-associated protein Csy2